MGVDAPSLADLDAAAARLRGRVHRTPVMTCATFDERLGLSVFFKCENFQKVGAFKFRGATNAVQLLSDDEAARGVVTHSSGNHAQALALAARQRGIRAWIVMPENAPAVKRAAVEGYGATIVTCASTIADRETTAARVQDETGATFIHPYDDVRIIAGQSTAARELLEDVPDLDALVVPVGGGGLASGTCLSAHAHREDLPVYGAEPEGADDARRSLEAGRLVPVEALPGGGPDTIADGLRTSLSARTFAILRAHLTSITAVPDEATTRWLHDVWARMKILIEPSSAVPLAALEVLAPGLRGQRVGVIFSGGNVSLPPAG